MGNNEFLKLIFEYAE